MPHDVANRPLKLEIKGKGSKSQRASFAQESIIVGSGPAANLQLEDVKVSRMHAMLKIGEAQDELSVIDLGSTEGTFVRGKKIAGETKLVAGDELRVGETVIVVSGFGEVASADADSDRRELDRRADERRQAEAPFDGADRRAAERRVEERRDVDGGVSGDLVSFACDKCGERFAVKAEKLEGKKDPKFKCKKCEHVIHIKVARREAEPAKITPADTTPGHSLAQGPQDSLRPKTDSLREGSRPGEAMRRRGNASSSIMMPWG